MLGYAKRRISLSCNVYVTNNDSSSLTGVLSAVWRVMRLRAGTGSESILIQSLKFPVFIFSFIYHVITGKRLIESESAIERGVEQENTSD